MVYALIAKGEIATVNVGGSKRIAVETLKAWIASKKVNALPEPGAGS